MALGRWARSCTPRKTTPEQRNGSPASVKSASVPDVKVVGCLMSVVSVMSGVRVASARAQNALQRRQDGLALYRAWRRVGLSRSGARGRAYNDSRRPCDEPRRLWHLAPDGPFAKMTHKDVTGAITARASRRPPKAISPLPACRLRRVTKGTGIRAAWTNRKPGRAIGNAARPGLCQRRRSTAGIYLASYVNGRWRAGCRGRAADQPWPLGNPHLEALAAGLSGADPEKTAPHLDSGVDFRVSLATNAKCGPRSINPVAKIQLAPR